MFALIEALQAAIPESLQFDRGQEPKAAQKLGY